ncbi:MAG TPA: sigma-54-dependent Fis family transcriptional regulator, partial [Flavobacteriaceae bacterium]|nr:sigma-54-dependent Fis family transcriptional regulator [Flavobacteriaceae bacterium]
VEDDIAFAKMLATFLERKGFTVISCSNGAEGKERLKTEQFDLLISDLKLPDDNGMSLLEHVKKTYPNTRVILMTGYAEVNTAVEAIKKGAL